MPRLFFQVSGEHPTLPFAEIKAILESESLLVEEITTFPRVICLRTQLRGAQIIAKRSSFVKVCALELFRSRITENLETTSISEVPFDQYLESGESFAVRIKAVGNPTIKSSALASWLGNVISRKVEGSKVDLKTPDKHFYGLMVGSDLVFGLKLTESSREIVFPSPVNRPFFHPSAMASKLARCMVNLARVTKGSLLLDPFCGTGSILLEAGSMECQVLGCDIQKEMVKGCQRNLQHFNIPYSGLIVSDARRLPLYPIDAIVSDPPYGRASSRRGIPLAQLVEDFLSNVRDNLSIKGYISLALPSSLDWRTLTHHVGLSIVEEHFIREHKNLTRVILLLKQA